MSEIITEEENIKNLNSRKYNIKAENPEKFKF